MTDEALLVAVGLLRWGTAPDGAPRYAVARRHDDVHLPGTWELPGGKVEPGETPAEALAREIFEELGVRISDPRPLTFSWHAYPSRTVLLLFQEATIDPRGPEPRPLASQELRSLTAAELVALPLPPANAPLVALLRDRLRS